MEVLENILKRLSSLADDLGVVPSYAISLNLKRLEGRFNAFSEKVVCPRDCLQVS